MRFLLELGVPTLAFEEPDVGVVKRSERLLERDSSNLLKPRSSGIGFPESETLTSIVVGNGRPVLVPHLFAKLETLVVDETAAPNGPPEEGCLILRGIEPKFVGFFGHGHYDPNMNWGRFQPRPEVRVFPT